MSDIFAKLLGVLSSSRQVNNEQLDRGLKLLTHEDFNVRLEGVHLLSNLNFNSTMLTRKQIEFTVQTIRGFIRDRTKPQFETDDRGVVKRDSNKQPILKFTTYPKNRDDVAQVFFILGALTHDTHRTNKGRDRRFDGLDFRGLDFHDLRFHQASFRDCHLYEAIFETTNLWLANFAGANLDRATFYRARVKDANFYEANLTEVNFYYADLREANFKYANLQKANFERASLFGADFTGADFKGTEGLTQWEIDYIVFEDGKPPKNLPLDAEMGKKIKIPKNRAYVWEYNEHGRKVKKFVKSKEQWSGRWADE